MVRFLLNTATQGLDSFGIAHYWSGLLRLVRRTLARGRLHSQCLSPPMLDVTCDGLGSHPGGRGKYTKSLYTKEPGMILGKVRQLWSMQT